MQMCVKYEKSRTHSFCCHAADSEHSWRFPDDSTNASATDAAVAAAAVAVDFAIWPRRLVACQTT